MTTREATPAKATPPSSSSDDDERSLPFGKLPVQEETIDFSDENASANNHHDHDENSNEASAMEHAEELSSAAENSAVQGAQKEEDDELGQSYKMLERMRRLNLEVACQEKGISPDDIDHEACSHCLLANQEEQEESSSFSATVSSYLRPQSDQVPEAMPRLKKFVERREEQWKPKRCLTCGAPCCSHHSSPMFRDEGITVCGECEEMFSLDYLVSCCLTDQKKQEDEDKSRDEDEDTKSGGGDDDDEEEEEDTTAAKKELQERLNKVISLYDRVLLLLKFSHQYMDQMIVGLEESKILNDKINVGGSSVGVLSGILGVAAAATIVTPAGVPLLVASLMLGTGATAAQTGTEVSEKYFSEPNQFANRVLALHGIALRILSNVNTLRDVVHDDYMRMGGERGPEGPLSHGTLAAPKTLTESKVLAGVTTGRLVAGSAELFVPEGLAVARGARQFSRAGTGALRSLRFARFAGGALAAATIVLEAHTMASTVQAIQEGSPCEKAELLKKIQQDIPKFSGSVDLDEELSSYLLYIQDRGFEQDEITRLISQVSSDDVDGSKEDEKGQDAAGVTAEEPSKRLFSGALLKSVQDKFEKTILLSDYEPSPEPCSKEVASGELVSKQQGEAVAAQEPTNRLFSGALLKSVQEKFEETLLFKEESLPEPDSKEESPKEPVMTQKRDETTTVASSGIFSGTLVNKVRAMRKPQTKEEDVSPQSGLFSNRFSEWTASEDVDSKAASASTSSLSERWNRRPRLFAGSASSATSSLSQQWKDRPRLFAPAEATNTTMKEKEETGSASSLSTSKNSRESENNTAAKNDAQVCTPDKKERVEVQQPHQSPTREQEQEQETNEAGNVPGPPIAPNPETDKAQSATHEKAATPTEKMEDNSENDNQEISIIDSVASVIETQTADTATPTAADSLEENDEDDNESWDVVDEGDTLAKATANIGSSLFESGIQE